MGVWEEEIHARAGAGDGEGVDDVAGKVNSLSVRREGEFVGNSGQSRLAGAMEITAQGGWTTGKWHA